MCKVSPCDEQGEANPLLLGSLGGGEMQSLPPTCMSWVLRAERLIGRLGWASCLGCCAEGCRAHRSELSCCIPSEDLAASFKGVVFPSHCVNLEWDQIRHMGPTNAACHCWCLLVLVVWQCSLFWGEWEGRFELTFPCGFPRCTAQS